MDTPIFSTKQRLVVEAKNSGDYTLEIAGTASEPDGFMTDADISSANGITTITDYAQGGRTATLVFDGEITSFPNKLKRKRVEQIGLIPTWVLYVTGAAFALALFSNLYS